MTAIQVCVLDGPTHHRKPEESGIKIDQTNVNHPTTFLCSATSVDAQKTKSFCCVAVGITAPISSTAEALVPHEKLREAAHPDATLIAQNRPPAQLVVGCKHVPSSREEWAALSPKHVAEFTSMACVWQILEAAQERMVKLYVLADKLAEDKPNASHKIDVIGGASK